jgi:hypothetical protein
VNVTLMLASSARTWWNQPAGMRSCSPAWSTSSRARVREQGEAREVGRLGIDLGVAIDEVVDGVGVVGRREPDPLAADQLRERGVAPIEVERRQRAGRADPERALGRGKRTELTGEERRAGGEIVLGREVEVVR